MGVRSCAVVCALHCAASTRELACLVGRVCVLARVRQFWGLVRAAKLTLFTSEDEADVDVSPEEAEAFLQAAAAPVAAPAPRAPTPPPQQDLFDDMGAYAVPVPACAVVCCRLFAMAVRRPGHGNRVVPGPCQALGPRTPPPPLVKLFICCATAGVTCRKSSDSLPVHLFACALQTDPCKHKRGVPSMQAPSLLLLVKSTPSV